MTPEEQRALLKAEMDQMYAERFTKINHEFKEAWRTATPETRKQIYETMYNAMLEQAKQVAATIIKGELNDQT